MCYDSDANQLVIPMNGNNGLAFISLIRMTFHAGTYVVDVEDQ